MLDSQLFKILENFQIRGEVVALEECGDGHINDTYRVTCMFQDKPLLYSFQRINTKLFSDVEALMHNIELVTDHIKKNIKAHGGDVRREGLFLIRTIDDKTYYHDKDNDKYYRAYLFIDDATCYQVVDNPKIFYESAVAFGNFANMLADFDAAQLVEVLPNFHNTPIRYKAFIDVVEKDVFSRKKDILREIEFITSRENYASKITSLLDSGMIPYRVTHNDTKLNNVMIDKETGKGIAVLDLDTVMPGSLCYDFGDAIRFGCNPAAEDEKDLNKVNFRLDYFESYTKGYLSAVGDSITQLEKDTLALSAIVITYECGMRFLTDYLNGDSYFRIHREGQNLDRARTQFKMIEDMEKLLEQMKSIVNAN